MHAFNMYQRSVAWTEQLSLPYESAFVGLQKFAWANCLSPTALTREFFSKRFIPPEPGTRELFNGAWIKSSAVRLPKELRIQDGFAATHGAQWMRLLCKTDTLRFCEECLQDGFHSLLYQIEGLIRCPRHLTPCREACAHCETPIPLSLCKAAFARPFRCPRCQQPLGHEPTPQRWRASAELVAEIRRALEPIACWLKDLSCYIVTAEHAPLAQLALAGIFEGESDRVAKFDIARQFARLGVPEELCAKPKRSIRVIRIVEGKKDVPQVPPLERWQRDTSCFRAVRRHLMRTALRRHRRCLRKAAKSVWMRSDFRRQVIEQEPGLCPIAAGFLRWQKRYWEQAEEDRRFDRGVVSVKVDPPDSIRVIDLMAQFHSCVATAYVCESLHRQDQHQTAVVGSARSELLHRYSCGTFDSDASWVVQTSLNGVEAKWVVRGEALALSDHD